MRVIVWFIRIVLFLVLFGFAIKNNDSVTLQFYTNKQWPLPLSFIILVSFAVGAVLGVTATITTQLRRRREIARLRKQLERAESMAAEVAPPPEHL